MRRPIIIIDFGGDVSSQNCKNLLEKEGEFSVIMSFNTSVEEIMRQNPVGIILSGSPDHVYESESRKAPKKLFELDLPILGICYGMQLIAQHFGAKVKKMPKSEKVITSIFVDHDCLLFADLPKEFLQQMDHYDHAANLPHDFIACAHTNQTKIAAFEHVSKPLFGIQFHLESNRVNNDYGSKILRNFCRHCKDPKINAQSGCVDAKLSSQ